MQGSQNPRTRTSIRTLQVLMVGLGLVVLGRVFYLQFIEFETYAELGEKNSVRQEYVDAARGLIYDRNANLLVDNEPIYTITITPANFDEQNIPLLSTLLGIEDSVITEKVKEAQNYSWQRSSRLFTEIDFSTFSKIEENIWRLPGIGHQIESKRHYPSPINASHIFGYLREADREEYQRIEDLRLGDKIGKSGLEMTYEDQLRGELGVEYLTVNAFGQSLGTYGDEKIGRQPVQGGDLITTLDLELQKFAEEIMKGKEGALVAMDPRDGGILALVSSPDYELSRLAGRLDQDYWVEINTDSTTPLYNRAISGMQPPGSIFKPLMGIVGMELGLISPDTEIYNSGQYFRGRAYRDLADPGNYNLEKALAYSSNTYFFSLMDKIASRGMLNTWSELVKDFGLGVSPGIDLPSARSGIIPDSTFMDRRFGARGWGLGDVMNFGVGQGLVSASPLQVAQMTASIANGGYSVQPHVVQAIRYPDGTLERRPVQTRKIPWVKDYYIETVKEGMRRVVTEGSSRYYTNHPEIAIAGKTGTAENPHGRDHGWFTSFAPLDKPRIVVVVLIENGGYGSISAAPTAVLAIEKYLNGSISDRRKFVYNYVINFESRPTDSELIND